MKRLTLAGFLTLVFLVGMLISDAQATLVWDWSFTNNNGFYSPTDTVSLMGTLYNNSTAGETIGSSVDPVDWFVVSFGLDSLPSNYDFKLGAVGDPFSQFSGLVLNAGESFNFLFGTYTPQGGSAPAGVYTSNGHSIGLGLLTQPNTLDISAKYDFGWTVCGNGANCGTNNAVPEPATMILFGTGLAGAFVRKRFTV